MTTTPAAPISSTEQQTRRRHTIRWVTLIGFLGLLFDGYDLVVYGILVPGFLRDPSQLGEMTPATAGAIGSYALAGTLVGAILVAFLGDIIGRRRILLAAFIWSPVCMGITAFTSSVTAFAAMRFITGVGIGLIIAVTGTIIAEFAPPGKKNNYSAIAYAGVGTGGVVAAVLAIFVLADIGWKGMLLIGVIPLVLVPLAWFKLPESPAWLYSRGAFERAQAIAEKTGAPLVADASSEATTTTQQPVQEKVGLPGLLRRAHLRGVVLFAAICLLVQINVAVLQVWLPELMNRAGFSTKGSVSFLIALNGGAVIGALIASRIADRIGVRPVVAGQLLIGAAALWLVTRNFPISILLIIVAFAGLGAGAVVNLLYGFMAQYFRTSIRGAGLAWGTSWGRLGNIVGPSALGLLVGAGFALNSIFYLLAGVALTAMVLTLLVPIGRTTQKQPANATNSVPAMGG
jgi:AAHS family benzoate transporter-like MFS transporter